MTTENNLRYIFMFIDALRLRPTWWEEDPERRKERLWKLRENLQNLRKEFLLLRTYSSLRWDTDLIVWGAHTSTEPFHGLRASLRSSLGIHGEEQFSTISIYETSPYKEGGGDLSRYLAGEESRYFVAYPMKKAVDWYLLPFEERREVMKEHMDVAKGHPEVKGIRAYTTYSFGLGDQEFVVIYEMNSLPSWSHVVEKLREVKARKWITKEEPLLVGEKTDFSHFLR
ncbi:chlorite dismutase [Sulfodiicoccus acidiphilus]|uniref:Chlorite dismutase n=1 Tax=Sulfodiicoccus acidiphilus TaxID=1670455 RepID=A0A348B2C6_9CREN|nr:chlorite dismutase family protein [Sulfodiicoccus acidiphilus]BBD72328.1 chlorite dismutase [Sulfodiicoccus acidiphilus]GGT90242.1 chlorite dismutase [Sulfodiicoccus acidiphilus]